MLFEVLVGVFFIAVGAAVTLYQQHKTYKPPEGSALDEPIKFDELRNKPAKLARVADKISSVGIIRFEQIEGRNEHTVYEAFVIDSNGIPVTIAQELDHATALEKAQWLAAKLDVPLDDQSD
ncbi:hypothetical protein FIV42_11710 [Persicimonas caeni]|uniref:Uncharacterized protein n=1 Tax=Persicimonas caeni TaxID=2292766 RepID=A0A4Y6PSS4_PERCE|nr:hypothetical protein [Persicimonas caeni]QDG51381.1 hypothetical protein FIV42_11710 [Persicimonas caeni]QED32602.1 hypothetical protein FRD00_11705 [Persicimonas caeni]